MTSYIRLYRSSSGWRWTQRDANGRIIGASTESYVRRVAALRNLNRVTGLKLRLLAGERKSQFQWRVKR